jgi:hypothetical protein
MGAASVLKPHDAALIFGWARFSLERITPMTPDEVLTCWRYHRHGIIFPSRKINFADTRQNISHDIRHYRKQL